MLTTMSRGPAILIIDSNASDSDLSALLLKGAFPDSEVSVVNDALAFADILASRRHDVAIVAPKLTWAASEKVLRDLKRRMPGAAVILFGHEADIVQQSMSPALVFDGIARKSSAGFIALGDIVSKHSNENMNAQVIPSQICPSRISRGLRSLSTRTHLFNSLTAVLNAFSVKKANAW